MNKHEVSTTCATCLHEAVCYKSGLLKKCQDHRPRTGAWVEWYPPKHMILTGEEVLYRCSACDAKYADTEGFRHCPNCGVLIDSGEEGTP